MVLKKIWLVAVVLAFSLIASESQADDRTSVGGGGNQQRTCADYLEEALEKNLGISRQIHDLQLRASRDYLNELRHAQALQQHPSSQHDAEDTITQEMIDDATENFNKNLAAVKEFEESSMLPMALATCIKEAGSSSSSEPRSSSPAGAVTLPVALHLLEQSMAVAMKHTARMYATPAYVLYRHWAFALYVFDKLWATPDDLPQQMFHADINDRTALVIEASAYPIGAIFVTLTICIVGIIIFPAVAIFVVVYKWLWILWIKLFLLQGAVDGKIPALNQFVTAAPKWVPELVARAPTADLVMFLGVSAIVLGAVTILLLPWLLALRRIFVPTPIVPQKVVAVK